MFNRKQQNTEKTNFQQTNHNVPLSSVMTTTTTTTSTRSNNTTHFKSPFAANSDFSILTFLSTLNASSNNIDDDENLPKTIPSLQNDIIYDITDVYRTAQIYSQYDETINKNQRILAVKVSPEDFVHVYNSLYSNVIKQKIICSRTHSILIFGISTLEDFLKSTKIKPNSNMACHISKQFDHATLKKIFSYASRECGSKRRKNALASLNQSMPTINNQQIIDERAAIILDESISLDNLISDIRDAFNNVVTEDPIKGQMRPFSAVHKNSDEIFVELVNQGANVESDLQALSYFKPAPDNTQEDSALKRKLSIEGKDQHVQLKKAAVDKTLNHLGEWENDLIILENEDALAELNHRYMGTR